MLSQRSRIYVGFELNSGILVACSSTKFPTFVWQQELGSVSIQSVKTAPLHGSVYIKLFVCWNWITCLGVLEVLVVQPASGNFMEDFGGNSTYFNIS
jgi:hypothetical protein